ncbi:DUF397 domain-containing protein [Embleya sp. AB8]|uniref:DUF397 domain-containing protein n=1 Tax=Embleya sp. AB8 TaxID=3156304 RepID=UPI003C724FE6
MELPQSSWTWRTSTYTNAESSCVEVAPIGSAVTAVRDSKDRARGFIVIPPISWRALTDSARHWPRTSQFRAVRNEGSEE